jgi:hypothetical protein
MGSGSWLLAQITGPAKDNRQAKGVKSSSLVVRPKKLTPLQTNNHQPITANNLSSHHHDHAQ